jgi:hypothetical protein
LPPVASRRGPSLPARTVARMWWHQPLGRLNRLERWFLAFLVIAAAAFTALVLRRSTATPVRMTDAEVYFRAAWAVREGLDLYAVKDSHGWSYTYPPALAVLLAPLADAPPGEPRTGLLPYPLSVLIWLGVLWTGLIAGAAWTARAVALAWGHAWPPWRRRWWYDRVHPLILCLGGLGDTISRGQVNAPLLALCGGMLLAGVRGRRALAGVCLGLAAGIKLFPALLIVWPVYRRDARMLAGVAVGLAVMFAGVPLLMGPARAWESTRRFVDTMVLPQVGRGEDDSKVREHHYAVDNQSIMAMSHNARKMLGGRPVGRIMPDGVDRALHWTLTAGLVAAVLLAARRAARAGADPARVETLSISTLLCVMISASPVAHLHYFVLAMPLVAALLSMARDARGPTPLGWALLAAYALANILPHVPELRLCKLWGLAGWANLALIAAGVRTLAGLR